MIEEDVYERYNKRYGIWGGMGEKWMYAARLVTLFKSGDEVYT